MRKRTKAHYTTTCPHCGADMKLSAREVERADYFECSACREFFDANVSFIARTPVHLNSEDEDDWKSFAHGDDTEL